MKWTGLVHEWSKEECISVTGGKARRKETTRKNKTWLGGWIILTWVSGEIGWGDMDWIVLAPDRVSARVNMVMNLQAP
jgi:hypothetical protein